MLDNSVMTLLKHILENPTITVQSFLEIHHLSHRQFQIKLKQLNDYLQTLDFEVITIEHGRFNYDKQLENFLLTDGFLNEKHILFEEDMRVYAIYLYTFIRQESISNFHFQWLLQVSKNTVLSDMKRVRQGSDVTLIANGICVSEALKAAEQLEKDNISVEVIDCYCVKPLDKTTLLTSARQTNLVVTCENHNVIGGLGSRVAELLSENYPTPLVRLGIHEQFGQVGQLEYLKQYYRIDEQSIVDTIKQAVQNK